MIGGRKDCRAGKRCHPPPRPNEKTNGEGSRQLLSVRRYVFYIGKNSQASAKAPAFFLPSFVFLIKSYYFGSADEHYCFMYPSALFFKLTPYRIFRSVIVEEFFSIAVKHSHLVDLVYGWSKTQIFPRTIAHISLK